MKKKVCIKWCCSIIGFFLLSTISLNPAWAQQDQESPAKAGGEQAQQQAAQADEQMQPEGLFLFDGSIVQSLEGRISDEKFEQIGELKDKELSEAQLVEDLQGLAFSEEEIETVLNLVHERQKFIKAIVQAAPVALEMERIWRDIEKNEEVLESTQQEEEKKKLSDELRKQHNLFKQQENRLSQIISDIDGTQTEQISAVLKEAGQESDQVEVITRHILEQALFAKKIGTLSDMVESSDSIKKEIKKYEAELKNAGSEEQKKNISSYLSELNDRLEKTENDFSVLTTGIDYNTFLKKEGKEVDWEKELKEIFSPIIVELKETTERPRKMERLRSDILYLEKRIPQVQQASKDLDKFLEQVGNKKVAERLKGWKEYWQQLEKEFSSQLEADKNQLLQAENERKSLLASFKVFFDSFVKHRGKNLFFALLAFIGIYLLFRLIQKAIQWISPLHRSPKYMFWANLVDVMLYGLALLVATGALIAVLFTSGDWLILAIVMLLVLGGIWGARNTLPHFVEQIKLLLGFGPVRQGEKVMIDGIPYRVEMMGVYSYLNNPLLTGGTLRLPLKDLVGMRSRPYDENEPWFPCKEGDCVLIDNLSTWRKVIRQTPQVVEFDWFDMLETMPTSSFMGRKIFNISAAPFWAGINFSIAYKHRFEVLGDLRDKLSKFVEEKIKEQPYGKHVLYPWVDLAGLADSSLTFMIWVQVAPEAADKYGAMSLHLNQIALEAANKYGWDILQYDHKMDFKPEGIQGNEVLMPKTNTKD
ncbi:MAG: hypothetical protein Q3M24_16710 [Candidatus Electrothrix aestuarii]|uniref:Mechanosensitive ion channel n=1 Tax=Candidatus Electrothrix aestuarii TaxID=3062594 RepID=A0AAU8LS13_9BACT|nr:hypothetical protein [Candidatus Electrothrix aestuarii]